ncbi:hypothetical protein IAD21_04373 [Abditibacteriota bacterium]|nr:hypothetical protein IAD21_04373 [Abditibacteriota bacterium]
MLRISPSFTDDRETIRNVRLRLNTRDAREAGVQVISPPAAIEELGGGRYFVWDQLAVGQSVKVRLRPRHTLKLNIAANGFNRFQLEISPQG